MALRQASSASSWYGGGRGRRRLVNLLDRRLCLHRTLHGDEKNIRELTTFPGWPKYPEKIFSIGILAECASYFRRNIRFSHRPGRFRVTLACSRHLRAKKR